jgi:hypothetical protein
MQRTPGVVSHPFRLVHHCAAWSACSSFQATLLSDDGGGKQRLGPFFGPAQVGGSGDRVVEESVWVFSSTYPARLLLLLTCCLLVILFRDEGSRALIYS